MVAEWDCKFLKKLWVQVDLKGRYDFRTGCAAQAGLRAILPKLPDDFFRPHPQQLNRLLREKLAPHLRTRDQRSKSLARWIIVEWGRIGGGRPATIPEWMSDLGNFNDRSVERFVAAKGTYRISSWSKLLAFANHKRHAIYDARTSVALNCALRNLGDRRQFYMPSGRNKAIGLAQRILSAENVNLLLGYTDYIKLLRTIVKCKLSTSILAAEMVLFANAPCMAQEFVADRSNS